MSLKEPRSAWSNQGGKCALRGTTKTAFPKSTAKSLNHLFDPPFSDRCGEFMHDSSALVDSFDLSLNSRVRFSFQIVQSEKVLIRYLDLAA